MKRNTANKILVALLFLSASTAALFSVRFFFTVREMQSLQGGLRQIATALNTAQALFNETVEHSRKNPALLPLVKQFEASRPVASTNVAPPPVLSTPR